MSARDLPPELWQQTWRSTFAELRASIRASVERGLDGLKTPEPITLDEWADREFYLSAESSQNAQRWRAYPPQRGMLGAMGDDDIEEVDVRKSARVGYTKMLVAAICYDARHKRRNQCLWQPTDGDSDEFCKTEIEPALRDVKAMRKVFPQIMAKSKANTLSMKKFLGSVLYLKGGTSAANFRRMTLQSAKLDEFDAFDQKIEKSADPFTLAYKRLEGATYPKIICGSTPRIKGLSHIEKREAAAEAVMRFHITCPHCQAEHPLLWGGKDVAHGFKWDVHDPEGTVRHVCPHCRASITQSDYLRIWDAGVWISRCGNYRLHHKPKYHWTDGKGTPLIKPPRHVAFHIWTAYSPQATWAAIVRQFLECIAAKKAGDTAPLEGFVNETLGETWEEEVERAESHILMQRAEDYPLRRVPIGGLQLVAGVDVQDKRWEVTVWAIGRGEEMWTVDYQVIDGNLSEEGDWETRLLPYLRTVFTHTHGAPMRIAAAAVDTGGHYTHQVYNFCRKHQTEKIFAVKGDDRDARPIKSRVSMQDINHRGRIVRNGIKLWFIGTDTAKDLFFGRLKLDKPGPGYVHFSKYLPVEWFTGLTSEVRRTIKTSKGPASRWVKTTARNEPLDTTVYAIWCSQQLDHHKLTDAQWAKLENDLLPDLFAPAAPVAPTPPLPLDPLPPGQILVRESPPPETSPVHTSAQPAGADPPPLHPPLHPQQRPAQVAQGATAPAAAPPAPSPFAATAFASAEWAQRL